MLSFFLDFFWILAQTVPMAESSIETKKKLLESAKKEFLQKGFAGASLRTIAANAGVTTGAMYRHFKDKDDFFCALVDGAVEATQKVVMFADSKTHAGFDSPNMKEHIDYEKKMTFDFLKYVFENFDAFELLLTKAAGSAHERFQEDICELYTKNCEDTFNWMRKQGFAKKKVSSMTVHFMASTVINAFCDIILHKMTKRQAASYISDVMEFTRAGWIKLMGLD